jgi:tRNA (cytidine/uridine-2'-O-)-methyltransferase
MLNVVLLEPEIPGNTGSIIRLSANTGIALHLIHPLGFDMEEAALRRAGLDYHEWARVTEHQTLSDCLEALKGQRVFALTGQGIEFYHEVAYQEGDILIFGKESVGLPTEVISADFVDKALRIPMLESSRSLNLSNSVAVVVYEALRQLDHPELS